MFPPAVMIYTHLPTSFELYLMFAPVGINGHSAINLPRLTGNRTITKITAGGSFSDVEEVEGDKSTVFAANVVMEYEVE